MMWLICDFSVLSYVIWSLRTHYIIGTIISKSYMYFLHKLMITTCYVNNLIFEIFIGTLNIKVNDLKALKYCIVYAEKTTPR